MDILFISQYFWPEDFKGNDVAFELAERGHKVTILTGKPNYPQGSYYDGYSFFSKSIEVKRGVTILRVPILPRKRGKAIDLALNYFSFVVFCYWAFLFRLKDRYDVIVVQQLSPIFSALPGVWLKKKYGTPLVLWVLDLWPESLQALLKDKFRFLISWVGRIVRRVYNHSDHILISSRSFEYSIRTKLKQDTPLTYFPNWAEDIFLTDRIRNGDIISLPAGFNIMFTGNVGEAQDFDAILNAARITRGKGINWIIVGDGRRLLWIRKEIEKHKLENVILKGRHPVDKMPDFFRAADAMLVTLKNNPVFSFTVPAKMQAYMASGKIILGMLNGEGAEMIKMAQCGYAVNAGDASGLAEKAIKMSMLTSKQKDEFMINSRKFYQDNFDKKKLLDQLENIIIQLTNSVKSVQ